MGMIRGYDSRLGVIKYVGVVTSAAGMSFMVFECGDSKCWLFCQTYPVEPGGGPLLCTGLNFPVAKKRLDPRVARALNAGCGYDARLAEQDRPKPKPGRKRKACAS